MSIDTTPPDGGFPPPGFECLTCYPGGGTSQRLFMCCQGIEIGDLWTSADPDPPNDSFPIDASANCIWTSNLSGFDFSYRFFGGFTQVQVRIPAGANAFFQFSAPACGIWFQNLIQSPVGQKYFGGWCTVLPQLTNGPFSMPDLLELLSDDPTWAAWLQPRPMESDQVVYGLYGGPTHSNIRIKIDHS